MNDEVSSAAVNLQQLSLGMEEPALPPSEDNHAVVFPDYMQAFAADWSHLSFGTYKSGAYNAVSGGSIASTPVKTNLEETSAAANSSSALCKEIRHGSFSLIPVVVLVCFNGSFYHMLSFCAEIQSTLTSTFEMSNSDPYPIHINLLQVLGLITCMYIHSKS